MIERRLDIRHTGRFHVLAADEGCIERAFELLLPPARKAQHIADFVPFGSGRAYFKASPLRGRARLRHSLRIWFGRRRAPRVNEFWNLSWLREHGFLAPRPLVAGTLTEFGAPRYQFLFSQELPQARTLQVFLEQAPAAAHAALITELAREVARMHALGFIHHDLFPRNLLVPEAHEPRRVAFVDAWRGGPQPQLRGAAYDLGCLMLEGAELFGPELQQIFFRTYLATRSSRGERLEAHDLSSALERERRSIARRSGGNCKLAPLNWMETPAETVNVGS